MNETSNRMPPAGGVAPRGEKMPGIALGLLVLLAAVVFFPADWLPVENFDPPKRALLALGAVALLCCGLRRAQPLTSAWALGAGLLAWLWLRTGLRANPWIELGVLCAWTLPVLLFLAGLSMRGRAWRGAACGVGVAALLQAALMLLQRFGLDPVLPDTTVALPTAAAKMIGTIGYHNQAAGFLAVGLGAFAFAVRRPLVRAVLLVVAAGVIGATGCRGAVAGVCAATLTGLTCLYFARPADVTPKKKRVAGLLGLLALLALVLLAPPTLRQRVNSLFQRNATRADVGSRLLMTRVAWQMWTEHPLAGWGAGAFAFQYIDRLGRILPAQKEHRLLRPLVYARETHNDYLQFAAEFGLVGCVLAGALLALVLRRLWRQRARDPAASALGVFLLTYLGVHAVVSFPLQTVMDGSIAALLLGLVTAAEPSPDISAAPRPRWWWSGPVCALLIAVVTALLLLTDAWLCLAIGRLSAGADLATEARRLPPWAHRYRALLGARLAQSGGPAEARPLLEAAAQGYGDLPLLNNLGHCYARLGQWPEALAVYQRQARAGLAHRDALQNVSVALENLRNEAGAADALAEKLRLWPADSWDDTLRLAALRIKTRQPAQAAWLLRTFATVPEDFVLTLPGRQHADGYTVTQQVQLSSIRCPLDPRRTLQALVLPTNSFLRIFAVSCEAAGAVTPVDLSAAFNAQGFLERGGIVAVGTTLDRGRYSLCADDFPRDGALRDAAGHLRFQLGRLKNVAANCIYPFGQRLALPAGPYDHVSILCTAVQAQTPARDLLRVEYADSSAWLPVQATDWTRDNRDAYDTPPAVTIQALNLLAAAWLLQQQPELAVWPLQRVLALQPDNAIAKKNLEKALRVQPAP